jgi:hypothetical protein
MTDRTFSVCLALVSLLLLTQVLLCYQLLNMQRHVWQIRTQVEQLAHVWEQH